MPEDIKPNNQSNSKLNLSLDYRIISVLLLLIVIVMLAVWKPWNNSAGSKEDRTIAVTGEAQVTAEPDEYVFNPNYQFKGNDKAALLAALTKKSDEIVTKLKELGVKDRSIKTHANGSEYYTYYYDPESKQDTYNLSLTVKASDRTQSQKIQDYLITTNPTGQVSPQANFSDAKRKELESQARDEATKEARAKADQSAKNLGFKVGSVKSVQDGTGFGIPPIHGRMDTSAVSSGEAKSQLSVQPGENDLHYSVTVVYFLR